MESMGINLAVDAWALLLRERESRFPPPRTQLTNLPPEAPQTKSMSYSACHTNEDDVQGHLVVPVWVSLAVMACYRPHSVDSCRFQSGKRVSIWAELHKVNVPVLRRDLSRIKVGESAWARVHIDRIRAALMQGRGANAMTKKSRSGKAREIF
eukprot:1161593-Pelagomonas_calceolata.AAC.1